MTFRVFMSGQSNALGRGIGGPSWSAVDSRVGVWDNVNPLGANGTAFVPAPSAREVGTFQNPDRNNLGVWFAHRLAQVRGDDVTFTIAARGATQISGWDPGGDPPMLQECLDVWAATGQPPADIFVWHQGEGNTGDPPASYKAAFLALLDNLTTGGVIDANTTVIVGGLAEDGIAAKVAFNNDVLKPLAAENANIFYASSSGLHTYDDTHFTGDSLYTFGAERYFAAYAESQGFAMADLFALVNEGGTPGEPGTGENKLYNLLNLALIGMSKKDITLSPDFTGTPPANHLLTAAMLAAGSAVEYGTEAAGSFMRWESGLQLCWNMELGPVTTNTQEGPVYVSPNLDWDFPRPFVSQPLLIPGSGYFTRRWITVTPYSVSATTRCVVRALCAINRSTNEEFMGAAALGFWK